MSKEDTFSIPLRVIVLISATVVWFERIHNGESESPDMGYDYALV